MEFDAATVGDMWQVKDRVRIPSRRSADEPAVRDVPIHDLQSRVGVEGGTWIYNVLRGVEYGEGTFEFVGDRIIC